MSYPLTSINGSSSNQLGTPIAAQALLLLDADSGELANTGPTAAQIAGSAVLYNSATASAQTGLPNGLIFDSVTQGDIYAVKADGTTALVISDGNVVANLVINSIDLGDNDPINFGDANDIVMKWDGTDFLVTQATADSVIKWGVSGAGINHVFYGDTAGRDLTWDQTNDQLLLADNTKLSIGSGAGAAGDISLSWDASKLVVSQLTANSAVDWGVDGAGLDQNWYGDTASAKMMWDQSQDARVMSGAAVDLYTQAGSGTGVVADVIGPDLTHGVKRSVYSATVSPAAIETALFTIPAQSVVESVQASVVTALTGGGTTVTFSIGITGDVDLYGTATNAGVQADLLTQNAKLDCFGQRSANAGAGIGLYVAGSQALKLIGAATGGATAGDTALTVGSVKVRVVYRTMMSLADGA